MSNQVTNFVDAVLEQNPTHRSFMTGAIKSLSEADSLDLEEYLSYCANSGISASRLAECYNTLVMDTQREQLYFMKNGTYRNKTFQDVENSVYNNQDYMQRYMYGLAVSAFLWPVHNQLHHYFLNHLPKQATGDYLEIGPGHGYYFMQSVKQGSFGKFYGVDVSQTSIDITRDILTHFGFMGGGEHASDIALLTKDFLQQPMPDTEWSMIVMGEVLEHVESPHSFMERIHSISGPNTTVYITTCVKAPAIDHIYLFETTEEVDDMMTQSGFNIESKLYVPYAGKTLEQCRAKNLAINVAYVLSRSAT